jgi:hypothetical protein
MHENIVTSNNATKKENSMSRYQTAEWKELVSIQNSIGHIDILTITGFMDDVEFLKHLERYRNKVNSESK